MRRWSRTWSITGGSRSGPSIEGPKDTWASGLHYEPFIGRWSRKVAAEFLAWISLPPGSRVLDVGCGTGALSQSVLQNTSPGSVTGIDPSPEFVSFARQQIPDQRATFKVGSAESLDFPDAAFNATLSALVLNFVPQPDLAVAEMRRVTLPGGFVAAYLWDYSGGMELLRYFWDAAGSLDERALELDEGRRFPLCRPEPLRQLFESAELRNVEVRAINIDTVFRDFNDYWDPILGGQGPAPGYAMSLPEGRREELRDRIRGTLPVSGDGSIRLTARAWAVRGTP